MRQEDPSTLKIQNKTKEETKEEQKPMRQEETEQNEREKREQNKTKSIPLVLKIQGRTEQY